MKKILVVDDEKNIRTTIGYLLKEAGYEYEFALNGIEALDILEKNKFDLIISDVNMPGLDGMGLLSKLRERSDFTNILIMTAYGTVKDAVLAMKLQAIDYISKPFDPDKLLEMIEKVFMRENLHEEKLESLNDYIEFAKLCITKRDYDKGEVVLKRSLVLKTDSAPTFNLLGVLSELKDKMEIAHKYYTIALVFDPQYRAAVENLDRIIEFDSSKSDVRLG